MQLVDFATPGNDMAGVNVGPDGNIWFPESQSSYIDKVASDGAITRISTPNFGSVKLLVGPDKRFYMGEPSGIQVYDAATNTTSSLPSLNKNWTPNDGVVASNNTMWFNDFTHNAIDVISTTGPVAQYVLPTANAYPASLINGPDGNMWFVESYGNKIGRITLTGQITEYPLPATTLNPTPYSIAVGPDGNMWFTEDQAKGFGGGNIGKITTDGQITEYYAQGRTAMKPIVAGPDGNMWVGATATAELIRVSMSGQMTFYPIPSHSVRDPMTLAVTPDGAIWFGESWAGRIGKLVLH